MNYPKNVIKEYPIAAYYFVTLLISWGGLIIISGGLNQINPYQPSDTPFLYLYLVTVAGPCVAGLLLIGLYDGIKGYRAFLTRLFKWRVKAKWYILAFFIAPVTVFTSLIVLSLFDPDFLPGIFSSKENPVASAFGIAGANKLELFLFVLMIGLFNGFVEEIGWTGFVTHRWKSTHLLISKALILGLMWGFWHFLSNYIDSANETGAVTLPLYIAVLLFSFLPPFRILMMWIYTHTESLFIAILMHASLNVFWILSMPNVLTGQQRMIWYLVWAAILWGLVAIISSVNISYSRSNQTR